LRKNSFENVSFAIHDLYVDAAKKQCECIKTLLSHHTIESKFYDATTALHIATVQALKPKIGSS
jgi:hypothetical protein